MLEQGPERPLPGRLLHQAIEQLRQVCIDPQHCRQPGILEMRGSTVAGQGHQSIQETYIEQQHVHRHDEHGVALERREMHRRMERSDGAEARQQVRNTGKPGV